MTKTFYFSLLSVLATWLLLVIGGLVTSTLLGLGVTPTVFYTFGRKAAKKAIELDAPASH